ncbi:MAG: LapA family protein [Acidiferrobacterales bacterium]
MKRLQYIILTGIVFFVGLTFAFQNKQSVMLSYYFGWQWESPLSLMLILALAIGTGIGYLVTLRLVMQARRELQQAKKETRKIEQEVENLRSLPIKDVI